ncbi:apolipoprotein F, partial [Nyctibius grandis]|uniref:apolipoprotein F n=1 Tax=Nyctibius grandis TaxID=48427 RepID=UPI0035BC8E59
ATPDKGGHKGAAGAAAAAAGRGRGRQRAGRPGAAAMPQALLFLLLLLLGLGGSAPATIPPGAGDRAAVLPGAGDRAAARALLTELAELVPPRALPGRGVPCQALRPEALPGFGQLPPPPRALARAAMALALSGAACAAQAEAEVLRLYRELGPPRAAAVLRGLARLRGAPAPPALTLLLRLARPGGSAPVRPRVAPAQPQGPAAGTQPTPPGVPAVGPSAKGTRVPRGACARPPACYRVPRHRSRRRREDEDPCAPPGEREAHGVLAWVPGVSTFYNLGTSLYFAVQGCEALASARALEVAEDLGYAGLAALTAGAGGPVALGLQLGLQPGLKAGVRALIGYFTSDGDPPPAPTAHSGPVLII